jgi:hypothetical protein
MQNEIRDRNGRLVGTLYIRSDSQELRDRNGTYCGKYDNDNNETRDRHGKLVGSGNLLMTLLPN